jgi:2-dehydro-3-deoxygalactonokinase
MTRPRRDGWRRRRPAADGRSVNDERATALIAIDWGTTSARAYRVAADGEVIASRSADLGIQRVTDGTFARALDVLLGDWCAEAVPRVACGMIGSRQGWIEAPYVDCPADLMAFGKVLARSPGGELAIVPGAVCRNAAGIPDVMRGEETQLVGAIAPGEPRVLALLPGTHSKWALVERGKLVAFATFMTGELFAVLLDHSILGRMADAGTPNAVAADAAFGSGLDRGLGEGALAHNLFGARTLALAGELEPDRIRSWLSGMLIGHEIAGARDWASNHGTDASRVRVIGSAALVERYSAALARAGIVAEAGDANAAARGLWRIAAQAGLVH